MNQPLVPPAERPFVAYDQFETVQETVWFNPTDKDILVRVHVGTRPVYTEGQKATIRQMRERDPGRYAEFRTGERVYVIKAGQRRSISSEFDQAIQQMECLEPDCTTQRLYCRDRTHHRKVMGGGYPQLVNESVQHRPIVHDALIPENAEREVVKKKLYEALLAKQASDEAIVVAAAKAQEAEAMSASANAHQAAAAAKDPSKDPAKKDK